MVSYALDERMKEFFKKNDIKRFASLDKEYTLNGKKACIFAKAKKYLSDKWNADLPELGVKRNMKNYFTFEKTPGGLAFRAFFGDF